LSGDDASTAVFDPHVVGAWQVRCEADHVVLGHVCDALDASGKQDPRDDEEVRDERCRDQRVPRARPPWLEGAFGRVDVHQVLDVRNPPSICARRWQALTTSHQSSCREYHGRVLRAVIAVACLAGCDAVFLDRKPVEDCPAEYAILASEPTRHRVSTTEATWQTAQADCVDDSPAFGITHLAVIDTFTEIDSIHAVSPVGKSLWVGYARDLGDPTETYYSVTGDVLPTTSALWNNGEPNNFLMEEYVVQLRENGLNDGNTGIKDLYVCECDGKHPTKTFVLPPPP
jgi:hypothetical protein